MSIAKEDFYNDFDELGDSVNMETDKRKVKKLVDGGVISAEDLANAPIYFMCQCGQEQDVDNGICVKCGADIS